MKRRGSYRTFLRIGGRHTLTTALGLLSLTACKEHRAGWSDAEQRIADRIVQVRELRTHTAAAWPGFDAPEYDTPLLYYTDSVCYAVDPPAPFRNRSGARLVYRDRALAVYKIALPDTLSFHMETRMHPADSTAYDYRTPFVHCSAPEILARTIPDLTGDSLWLPMVLHEYVHRVQLRHPGFAANCFSQRPDVPEPELARLHRRCEWFGGAVRAENEALLVALDATDPAARDSCIGRFSMLRAARKRQMAARFGDSTLRAEEIYELMEGTARYAEVRAGIRLGCYAESDAWIGDTDSCGYFFATGYNLVRRLVQQGADLSACYTGQLHPLDTYLEHTNT